MAMTPRQVDRNMDWRVVKITEVNTATGHIEATDQYDTPMMIDITNKPAFFQVPIVGEMWTVSRRGSDWLLEARCDRDDVSTPLDKMKPGDARIEAPGTIYITGTKVVTVETSAPPGLIRVSATVTMPFESPAIPPPILQPPSPSTNDILFFDSAKWTNSKLTNAMVSASAAIDYSKLSVPANSIEGSKLNRHIGASPPGSPSGGDLWIYNGIAGVYWQFIYDSSETTYKWKFVGGPPACFLDTGDASTAGNTWIGISGIVATPREGDYIIEYGDQVGQSPTANTSTIWDMQLGNGTTTYTEAMYRRFQAGNTSSQNWYWPSSRTVRLNLAVSITLQFFYSVINWDLISYSRYVNYYPARW